MNQSYARKPVGISEPQTINITDLESEPSEYSNPYLCSEPEPLTNRNPRQRSEPGVYNPTIVSE